MIKTKNILFLLLVFSCALSFSAHAQTATPDGPGEIIVKTVDLGLQVLKDEDLKGFDNREERMRKLWEIISPVFNFEETSKRALGRNWLKLNDSQRKEFVDTFSIILRDVYIGKSDSYQGEKIVFVRELVSGERGKVQTNFFTKDGKKVVVDFSMRKYSDNWKIYDVIIEGVSMVSNYRSQFNSIINQDGFDALMSKLSEKQQLLSPLGE